MLPRDGGFDRLNHRSGAQSPRCSLLLTSPHPGPSIFCRKPSDLEGEGGAEDAQWPAANPGLSVYARLCWDLDGGVMLRGHDESDDEGSVEV